MTRLLAALLALTLALANACRREAATNAPENTSGSGAPAAGTRARTSLVLVTLDTVRADRLGCYGYFRPTTPSLDSFSAQCLRFTRCLAPIAHTTPSHLSLFTGVAPLEHGITGNAVAARRPKEAAPRLRTLAQTLTERGVKTGGFVSATPVKRAAGLAEGFAVWSEPAPRAFRRDARATIAEALQFIDSAAASPGAPFFAWIHLFDAHAASEAAERPSPAVASQFQADEALARWLRERGVPDSPTGRTPWSATLAANDLYDAQLRSLDDELAALLARLDRDDLRARTAVVVTADHGEGLGQHGVMHHGFTCWDEQFRVPLLIRIPGKAPGVVDTTMSMLDIVPTLAGLLPDLDLAPLLAQSRGRDVLSEHFEPRPVFGMVPADEGATTLATSRWRLIRHGDGKSSLFDLLHDPHELDDVAAEHPDVVDDLGRALAQETARQLAERARRLAGVAPDGEVAEDGAVDAELLQQLRALGYAGDEDRDEATGEAGDESP